MEKQKLVRKIFKKGEYVRAINNKPLPENEVAPPLKVGGVYPVKDIFIDSEGNQHLDVGLTSNLNFVRSYETGEELPVETIHWCHPSRFEKLG